MTGEINKKQRLVRCPRCRNVLAEPTDVPVYACGGCGAPLQAKKKNNSTVDTTSQKPDDDSFGNQKLKQVFGDQEAGSSSNQQPLHNSTDEIGQNSYHDDPRSSNKDLDAANKAKNDSIKEYLFGKQKMKQPFNDHEASSSSNQKPLVTNIHNDPRSSTELSGHEDPESSPEAIVHNRIEQQQERNQKQDQDRHQENTAADATMVELEHFFGKQEINQLADDNETSCSLNQQLMVNSMNGLDLNNDHNELHNPSELTYNYRIDEDYHDDHDPVFLSCRHDLEFEDSGSEFEEAFATTRTVRGSDGGSNSKSSFKSLITEKLLDTRLKKPMLLDEDDVLSEDESADLHRHQRCDPISLVEAKKISRFGGKSYYEYEGSVSSFEGNDNQIVGKHRLGSIKDENVNTGSNYRLNRRNQIHPSNGMNGFHLNFKHRSQMSPKNPKMERTELLKMVRELQDQLERKGITNHQQVPLYNNHVLNYPGRYGPRMAFSGEATVMNRQLDGGLCHHCCPQDRHFSAQLPRQHVCCHRPHHEPNNYHSPRFSALSSPIHSHSVPEIPAPGGYRHRNYVTKPVHSPKKKRYVRPIAGGSPWIICYRCFKFLELPQSFLVFNKRHHSLRCGACSKVLDFTLSNGTHISRSYPEETIAAPPSSKVEDYDGLNWSWARPVSCSNGSFQKSYTTETERNGSREFREEKRVTMSRDPSGSTQPSSSKVSSRSKMTSGSKVEPRLNGSPLHRLMGYASVSRVIRD
ncbi:hypothetical protein R6Q57_005230 [Mikania cordata]